MTTYKLLGRTARFAADLCGDCDLQNDEVGIGACLVSAELEARRNDAVTDKVTVQYLTCANIPIPHGFSTRVGGVSGGAYASLNIGQTTEDAPLFVHENRLRLGAAVGFPTVQILNMVHETQVVRVDSWPKGLRKGDACVTNVPEIPLMITTADCVPLIVYDGVHKALGLAHAGWRGTVMRISQAMLAAMHDYYGTRPEDVQVAVGPSIGPCCFEVGMEVAGLFSQAFPKGELLKNKQELLKNNQNKKKFVNLWRANLLALLEAGVPSANVRFCGLCSMCNHELFYSYRRDKRVTGRLATMAMLPS